MKQIFKYPLIVTDQQELVLPNGAEILTVQVQRDGVYLWALVDVSTGITINRSILCYGTGHLIDYARIRRYIGTIQVDYGNLVFHFFEGV